MKKNSLKPKFNLWLDLVPVGDWHQFTEAGHPSVSTQTSLGWLITNRGSVGVLEYVTDNWTVCWSVCIVLTNVRPGGFWFWWVLTLHSAVNTTAARHGQCWLHYPECILLMNTSGFSDITARARAHCQRSRRPSVTTGSAEQVTDGGRVSPSFSFSVLESDTNCCAQMRSGNTASTNHKLFFIICLLFQ